LKNGFCARIPVMVLVFGLAFIGCDNGDPQAGSTVYIAGVYDDGYTKTPCYWKNGARTDLPIPAGTDSAWNFFLAVSPNGDVHITGAYVSGSYRNDDYTSTRCYWKNGVRTDLPAPDGTESGAGDIAIAPNGDVYIAGAYGSGSYRNDDYTSTACYWKNGIRADLPVPDGTESSAYFIAIASNGDVCILGSYRDETDTSTDCYWKNGVRTDLPVPAGAESSAYFIAIASNGDVYIAGYYESGSGYNSTWTACSWKNGIMADLSVPDGIHYIDIAGIAVSPNGDVYIAGDYESGSRDDNTYTSTLCYWKNGVRTDLPVPAGAVERFIGFSEKSIAVAPNGAVYIIGGYSDDDGDTHTACYWKNGVRSDLPLPAGAESSTYNIALAVSSNGDAYIAGSYSSGSQDDGTFTSTACYWKNGVRTDLGANSIPTSIAVLP